MIFKYKRNLQDNVNNFLDKQQQKPQINTINWLMECKNYQTHCFISESNQSDKNSSSHSEK